MLLLLICMSVVAKRFPDDIEQLPLADGLKQLLFACKVEISNLSVEDLALLLGIDNYVAKLILDATRIKTYNSKELFI